MSELGEHIKSSDELLKYLKQKGENHNFYKYYTSNNAIISSVLDTHSIYLSKGQNWNDIQDRTNFNPDDDACVRFGFCMSYTKSENVAMWMLYGRDDGFMLDIGKDIIKQCLNADKIEGGNIRDKRYCKEIDLDKKEYTIQIIDIIYYAESKVGDNNYFYIKRADQVEKKCSRQVINELRYCKKTLPWQYEYECRMIVTVDKTVKEIENCDTIKIEFDESEVSELKKRIYHSPNHKGDFTYGKSKLTGKIEWSLK